MLKNKIQKKNKKMKDSGISWIGDIPSDWNIFRIKNIFNLSKEKINGHTEEYQIYSLTMRGLKKRNIETNEGQIAASYDKYARLRKNDIVLNPMDLKSGFVARQKDDGIISPAYSLMRPRKKQNTKYFERYLQFHYFYNIFHPFGKGVSYDYRWTLGDSELMNFPILNPPKETQEKIVEFLDEKTGAVAGAVEKKKKMIELLKEKRSSIITHTVTKGLDKKTEMKDSGVGWLGDIPSEWEVRKLKFLSKTFASNVDKHSKSNEKEVSLCNYVDVYKNEEINNQLNFMKATAKIDQIRNFDIRKDNVLLTKDSETADDIGVPAYVSESFENVICGYHLYISRSFGIYGKYLFRFLQSHNVRQRFEISSNGVTRFGLSVYPLINTDILLPPRKTQQKIVEFLDKKTSEIDSVISKIEKQIELLDEYKASLIYHAVTGKMEI